MCNCSIHAGSLRRVLVLAAQQEMAHQTGQARCARLRAARSGVGFGLSQTGTRWCQQQHAQLGRGWRHSLQLGTTGHCPEGQAAARPCVVRAPDPPRQLRGQGARRGLYFRGCSLECRRRRQGQAQGGRGCGAGGEGGGPCAGIQPLRPPAQAPSALPQTRVARARRRGRAARGGVARAGSRWRSRRARARTPGGSRRRHCAGEHTHAHTHARTHRRARLPPARSPGAYPSTHAGACPLRPFAPQLPGSAVEQLLAALGYGANAGAERHGVD